MRRLTWALAQLPTFMWEVGATLVRANESALAARLRSALYRTRCGIDTGVVITNRRNFRAGEASWLYHACYVLNTHGVFELGRNSHLGAFCYVNVCHGVVRLGDDVAVGPGTRIIAYSNHYAEGRRVTEERISGEVVVGNNVFIGANCTLLPGTRIPDDVVVAAGAVVKGELEANAIYGGVPCRKLRDGWHR